MVYFCADEDNEYWKKIKELLKKIGADAYAQIRMNRGKYIEVSKGKFFAKKNIPDNVVLFLVTGQIVMLKNSVFAKLENALNLNNNPISMWPGSAPSAGDVPVLFPLSNAFQSTSRMKFTSCGE